jgi:TolA-binding protein
MNARKRGESSRALEAFEEFIRDYPRSPLAQDAYIERFRILAESGERISAARAARAYLRSFPQGFGHDEAAALDEGTERDAAAPRVR